MTKRANMNDVMALLTKVDEKLTNLDVRVSALEEQKVSTPKATETKSQTSTTKTSSKKKSTRKASAPKERPTYEEVITEKYGDKETRTKFVELKKKVQAEFKALGEAEGVWIPKRKYKDILTATTNLLNGKFNKTTVRKEFLKAAK